MDELAGFPPDPSDFITVIDAHDPNRRHLFRPDDFELKIPLHDSTYDINEHVGFTTATFLPLPEALDGAPANVSTPGGRAKVDWTQPTWIEQQYGTSANGLVTAVKFFEIPRTESELLEYLIGIPKASSLVHRHLDAFRSAWSGEAVLFLLLCPTWYLSLPCSRSPVQLGHVDDINSEVLAAWTALAQSPTAAKFLQDGRLPT